MIKDLFQVVNSNKGCMVSLSLCSIVKDKALSSFITYSIIENALFRGLEGRYEIKDGLPGNSHHEGSSTNGLLINLNERQVSLSKESKKVNILISKTTNIDEHKNS